MIHPIITVGNQKAILTYDIKNISGLSEAVTQVLDLLKKAAGKSEFFTVKRATLIKVDQKRTGSTLLRMHFVIPLPFNDKSDVEKLLNPQEAAETILTL